MFHMLSMLLRPHTAVCQLIRLSLSVAPLSMTFCLCHCTQMLQSCTVAVHSYW